MQFDLDLERIEKAAQNKFEENRMFFEYLKTQDSAAIDKMVHQINDCVSTEIKCVECGNCCHHIRPAASEQDLIVFVEPEQVQKVMYEPSIQCMHQKDKKCMIYLVRPQVCRSFPYLHLDGFVERSSGMIQNTEICPIVYYVLEELKNELSWTYNK
ncbi:YkgJ family cysteine cluster protein [Plebeiibacterium sediminum]|uniref:YkgJ family cysteine cluster protein n=1 Tax=Plebeiibacterium sediminum TaxID=2992112 RepID=A0AAE3M4A8_9BACT|nr:YkgJ family cysteine cluster protein [Plebeiobacterium sediminum]MCW3786624.1 YkgJ family cysteine cluster protein [Plebeiobacterium sediminum]